MRDCGLNAFPSLKFEKLKILDLAKNNIKYLLNNTFENITTLVELDLRYNQIEWNSTSVRYAFSYLSHLKIIKLSGRFWNADKFCDPIVCSVSVNELHIENDNVNNALLIASKFTNVSMLKIFCNVALDTDVTLTVKHSAHLHSLTQLKILSLIKCQINDVEQNFFKNTYHLTTLNMACNSLQIPQIIRQLGEDNSLSNLETLVLDKNINENPIANFSLNNLKKLSFSSSLRRISLQGIGSVIYNSDFWIGAPKLISIAFGHNLIVRCWPNKCKNNFYITVIAAVQHVQHIKAVFLNDIYPELYPICGMPDFTMNDIFGDNLALESTTYSNCTASLDILTCLDKHRCDTDNGCTPIVVPYCLKTLNLDHFVYYRWMDDKKNYMISVCNNSLEEIIASNVIMGRNGWSFNNLTLIGLHKLRKLDLHSSGLKYFKQINFVNCDRLEYLDVSKNFLVDVNIHILSEWFGYSLPALKLLNFTHCYLEEVPSTFLLKFPNLRILDLSFNRLKNFSLDLSNARNNLTINITKNYLKSFSDEFMQSLDNYNNRFGITLLLNDNGFECTCHTLSFLRWFQTTNVRIVDKEAITCFPNHFSINEFDVESLTYQCDEFRRNLYLSIGIASSLAGLTSIVLFVMFKYRWHLRWYIFLIKQRYNKRKINPTSSQNRDIIFPYTCFISQLGVDMVWIKEEIMVKIESTWLLGHVYVLDRDSVGGEDMSEVILDAIQQSSKLVFIVGSALSPRSDIFWFEFALSMSNVWRRKDIVIVLKDSVYYENMQCKLLRSFCHPKCSVKKVQLVGNKKFDDEFKQVLLCRKDRDDKDNESLSLLNSHNNVTYNTGR